MTYDSYISKNIILDTSTFCFMYPTNIDNRSTMPILLKVSFDALCYVVQWLKSPKAPIILKNIDN